MKLQAVQDRNVRDATPEREERSIFAQTPRGHQEVLAHGLALQRDMDELGVDGLEEPIHQAVKGGIALAHSFSLVSRQLKNIQDYATARRARKALPGTVAQKGGVITIHDVRAKEDMVDQDDVQKAERALIRAQKARIAQCNKRIKIAIKAWEPLKSILMMDKKAHEKWHARMGRLFVNRMEGKKK